MSGPIPVSSPRSRPNAAVLTCQSLEHPTRGMGKCRSCHLHHGRLNSHSPRPVSRKCRPWRAHWLPNRGNQHDDRIRSGQLWAGHREQHELHPVSRSHLFSACSIAANYPTPSQPPQRQPGRDAYQWKSRASDKRTQKWGRQGRLERRRQHRIVQLSTSTASHANRFYASGNFVMKPRQIP